MANKGREKLLEEMLLELDLIRDRIDTVEACIRLLLTKENNRKEVRNDKKTVAYLDLYVTGGRLRKENNKKEKK